LFSFIIGNLLIYKIINIDEFENEKYQIVDTLLHIFFKDTLFLFIFHSEMFHYVSIMSHLFHPNQRINKNK